MSELLPSDALKGVRIGISVSESEDLARLGLLEGHFRVALAEIARTVLVLGGGLAYGGHLEPEGYTSFLVKELHKYGRRDRPLMVCLAWQEHRRLRLSGLELSRQELGLYGEIVCLDPDGNEMDQSEGRDEVPILVDVPEIRSKALSGLRQYMAKRTQGRILIGGKTRNFQGQFPGIIEEALVSLEEGQPIYLAGGFGGATIEIAQALGVDNAGWLPKPTDDPPADRRLIAARARLTELVHSKTWGGLKNGLTDEENRRLAASHRPSEIAALISLGLGRRVRPAQTAH
jgi:hypothetical protein